MSAPSAAEVSVGTELPLQTFAITRADLVRYCGASGDFNVIHWNARAATAVGLPDVIAHGMCTMAMAGRVVTDWVGDPGRVVSYAVRFSRPVVVPDDGRGATLEVSGTVESVEQGHVVVALSATADGATVLLDARAVVRLP